jgi:hypothetical protein
MSSVSQIFPAHGSQDKDQVLALYAALCSPGHTSLLDEVDLIPGSVDSIAGAKNGLG